jgi:uncharacterized metal-binding protein YceD (DUF177 family)
MSESELSRTLRVDTLGATPRVVRIDATPEERAALARRFAIVAVERLEADVSVESTGQEPVATGRVTAEVVQSCSITGDPVPGRVEESFVVHFRAEAPSPAGEEEIELGDDELDVIFYEGGMIDVGEAVAQTLALALDPYPRAEGAEEALKEAGVKDEAEAGPFGALAALKDKLGK